MRIKATREARGISLREVARRIGVSPSLVSQIENGRVSPSVNTLFALVNTLDMPVDRVFGDDPEMSPEQLSARESTEPSIDGTLVQRASNRKVITLESMVRWERLTAVSEPGLEFLEIVYEVGGESGEPGVMQRHNGREFGVVLDGKLGVSILFDDYLLGAGDSISFDSTTPHRLWNAGAIPVRAIWFILGQSGKLVVE